jgi:hypothetical protein
MLGINSNTSGYATYRKSTERHSERIRHPGAPSHSETDLSLSNKTGDTTSLSSDSDEAVSEHRNNNISFEIDIRAKINEEEAPPQKDDRNEQQNASISNFNQSFQGAKQTIKLAKKKKNKSLNGSKNTTPLASTRQNHSKDMQVFNSVDSKFKKIDTIVNALKKNFSGSRYFDKVAENIVNCYDFNSKFSRIKEKHKVILERLDHSTIDLFKHTDQVFTQARSLNRKDDLRPSLFPIARDLNLLQNIYHFKFYDNLGKILLKNIHFGRLVYVHDFGLVQKIKYFHLLNNSEKNQSQAGGKRVMKLLNLKNEI